MNTITGQVGHFPVSFNFSEDIFRLKNAIGPFLNDFIIVRASNVVIYTGAVLQTEFPVVDFKL